MLLVEAVGYCMPYDFRDRLVPELRSWFLVGTLL